jgi:hypothetical protein
MKQRRSWSATKKFSRGRTVLIRSYYSHKLGVEVSVIPFVETFIDNAGDKSLVCSDGTLLLRGCFDSRSRSMLLKYFTSRQSPLAGSSGNSLT